MKTRFIINPISGTGKQKGIEDYITNNIDDCEIFYTKQAGDAYEITKQAVNNNIEKVVAIGGDGTVNECLKPLINSKTCLGVIPCGSGNGFALHIGMKNNPIEAIKQLQNTIVETIDTCSVNGIPFVNVSGIGFDAHISNLFAKSPERGFISYLKLVLQELNYAAKKYNIKYNGIERSVKAYMISFANTSQYGHNAKISPNADIKDGLIDFVIVNNFPKWKIPYFLIKLIQGKIHTSRDTEIIKCKKLEIETHENLIHIDGDPLKTESPITINILEKSLKILKPYVNK